MTTAYENGMGVLSFDEACSQLGDPLTCFRLVTARQHISLSPRYLGSVSTGVHEILDSQINLHHDRMDGVVMAYNGVKLLSPLGQILNEQPFIHIDLQAEFVLFQPTVGSFLKGIVNKVSRGHIGCLVHGIFNASMPRSGPTSGHKLGDEVLFEVTNIHTHSSVLSVSGRLTSHRPSVTAGGDNEIGAGVSVAGKRKAEDDVQNPVVHGIPPSGDAENDSPPRKKRKKSKHKDQVDTESYSFHPVLGSMTSTPFDIGSDVAVSGRTREPANDGSFIVDNNEQNDGVAMAVDQAESSSSKHKKKKKKHKRERDSSSCAAEASLPGLEPVTSPAVAPDQDLLSIASDMTNDSGVGMDANRMKPKKHKKEKSTDCD